MIIRSFIVSILIGFVACSKAPDIATRKTIQSIPLEKPKAFELLSQGDVQQFTTLPMRGDVRDQKHFWSGDFWPLNKGNINRRWNAPVRIGFNLRSPTREELPQLSPEKLAALSPSEKYDLLMGAYDYPLRNEVNQSVAKLEAEPWEGMINGWAVASVLHFEPQPKTLKNPDGIEIPFGSEDIKGLLGYYYAYHQPSQITASVGKPCLNRNCVEDVSAASFHLALANRLGNQKKPFLMDLDRSRDVWNHPVVAFESEYRGNAELHDEVTPGTVSIVRMKTTVTYIDEALNQTWAPLLGTSDQLETKQNYLYWLHLDQENNIIGGEWKSNERPDYIWIVEETPSFEGLLAGLNDLVENETPVE